MLLPQRWIRPLFTLSAILDYLSTVVVIGTASYLVLWSHDDGMAFAEDSLIVDIAHVIFTHVLSFPLGILFQLTGSDSAGTMEVVAFNSILLTLCFALFMWRRGREERRDRIDLLIARSALKKEGSISLDELMQRNG
jgi:hypothetical protein